MLFNFTKDGKLIARVCHEISQLLELDSKQQKALEQWVMLDKDRLLVQIPIPYTAIQESLVAALEQAAEAHGYSGRIELHCNIPIIDCGRRPLTNVKNIIAVSSAKGGVGKSTTAVGLALSLARLGARVGILDADIYGPSVPLMLGGEHDIPNPDELDTKQMQPVKASGVVANSIGYLVNDEAATIWRGPMVSRALTQLLTDTQWPLLDYLIVDMPPGTGDVQLTLCQQMPLSAAVVVSTPQNVALADAQKGIAMFKRLDIPVLGLVENMSYFACPHCQQTTDVFARSGAAELAVKHDIPLLAEFPLDVELRQAADQAKLAEWLTRDSLTASLYRTLAVKVAANVAFDNKHLVEDKNSIDIALQ